MKRIKRFILTFIALFILFPCLTNAATELSASTQNPIVGETLYVQLEANYGKTLNIRDFHVYLKYDPTYFEVVTTKWVKSRVQMGTEELKYGEIHIDKSNGNWTSGPIIQVELKVIKAGSTKIDIIEKENAYYTDGSRVAQTTAGIIINSVNPSTNVELTTLYVKGYDNMQPSFKKSQTVYNLTVPSDVDKIEIIAKKSDPKQTITGYGVKSLSYGPNKFKIEVTAQNKDSRVYELTVTRTDNRTGDLTLKTLSVSSTIIKYEKDKKVYEATVGRNTESVLISARTNDPMATLTGTGTKKLEIGLNTFELLVQSANGLEDKYTIKITRSTEEIEEPVQSSKLKSIKVNSLLINVNEDSNTYLYGISKEISELSIEPILVSPTATYEITGNEKLKPGINKINIKVTQVIKEAIPETENTPAEEAVIEESTYTLLVYKNPTEAAEVDTLDTISGNNNIVYTTIDKNTHPVSKETIEALNKNNKVLYYNVVNMYNGLLYQIKLPTNIDIKDYDLKLKKLSSGDLTYNTNLPSNTEVTLYLENKYEEGSSVQVYSYDEDGVYTLVTAGLEITNGYITFNTNEQKNYIITTQDLILVTSKADALINTIKTVLIVAVIGILLIILVPKLLKKKSSVDESKEPLY